MDRRHKPGWRLSKYLRCLGSECKRCCRRRGHLSGSQSWHQHLRKRCRGIRCDPSPFFNDDFKAGFEQFFHACRDDSNACFALWFHWYAEFHVASSCPQATKAWLGLIQTNGRGFLENSLGRDAKKKLPVKKLDDFWLSFC